MPEPPDAPGGAINDLVHRPIFWAALAGGVALFYFWRKNQAANSSSNTATPYGNPIAGGGVIEPIIFNGSPPATAAGTPSTPTTANGLIKIPNPQAAQQLQKEGFDILTKGNGEYYNPNAMGGLSLHAISTPTQASQLQKQGYKIYTISSGEWYNPYQNVKGAKK
jgi:hypothetical protein